MIILKTIFLLEKMTIDIRATITIGLKEKNENKTASPSVMIKK